MTELEKAARQALEFVEYHSKYWNGEGPHPQEIATTLRQALDQPAQIDTSAGTQVSKVWWDGDKLMAQPIPLESIYKEPEQPAQQDSDQRLVNLLCRIHRDGGHYIAEHGLEKAVADADVKVAELNAMSDTRPQAREPLLREIAALSANALDDYKLIQKLMAERQPLTDAQIGAVAADIWGSILIAPQSYQAFARAIEQAHGIGEKK